MATGVENVALMQLFDPNKHTLWLTVGEKNYPLSQYSATFALNEVPTASCIMATGTRVTPDKAPILGDPETLAESLSGVGVAPAKVTLNLEGSDWSPGGKKYGSEEKIIFEGYYAGLSYHRVGAKIQLTVSLVHQLIDLTFGSVFSEHMHPSNPGSLIDDAVIPVTACGSRAAGGAGQGLWVNSAVLGGKLPQAASFGQQLLKVLLCLTELDLFNLGCGQTTANRGRKANETAAAVLNLMGSTTGNLSDPLHMFPYPTAIASYIGKQLKVERGTSFWDLLVNKWCPDFMLAVSPLPSAENGDPKVYANIIPNMPTHKTPYKTLYLNDYVDFEMRSTQHRPLMAVGIAAPYVSASGGAVKWGPETEAGPGQPPGCVGGVWPEKPGATGQFLLLDAPGWLQGTIFSASSAGTIAQGVNTSSDPAVTDKVWVNNESSPSVLNTVLSRIARTYYMANALRGRSGSFGSKLRFDIAPGSTVLLKSTKDPTSVGTSKPRNLPTDLYAQVARVTYNINADTPVARTSYDCVALRNTAENENADYSSDEHPLFDGTWSGGTLINGWDF